MAGVQMLYDSKSRGKVLGKRRKQMAQRIQAASGGRDHDDFEAGLRMGGGMIGPVLAAHIVLDA
jgi:hypothetical protein